MLTFVEEPDGKNTFMVNHARSYLFGNGPTRCYARVYKLALGLEETVVSNINGLRGQIIS